MRLIFLDVDGVLNKATTQGGLDDACVELLLKLAETNKAEIVLSSTWRYKKETIEVRGHLFNFRPPTGGTRVVTVENLYAT